MNHDWQVYRVDPGDGAWYKCQNCGKYDFLGTLDELEEGPCMAEKTFEDLNALTEKVDPWVEWFMQHEGTEIGDMVRALDDAISACSSAQEHDFAYQMADFLRNYFKSAFGPDGWADEIVEMADENYEDNLEVYSEAKQAELREREPKPSEALKALPEL